MKLNSLFAAMAVFASVPAIASNWGNGSATDVDAYTIEIPAGTLLPAVPAQRMSSPLPAMVGGGS